MILFCRLFCLFHLIKKEKSASLARNNNHAALCIQIMLIIVNNQNRDLYSQCQHSIKWPEHLPGERGAPFVISHDQFVIWYR